MTTQRLTPVGGAEATRVLAIQPSVGSHAALLGYLVVVPPCGHITLREGAEATGSCAYVCLEKYIYKYCLTSTETIRLVGDGEKGMEGHRNHKAY